MKRGIKTKQSMWSSTYSLCEKKHI